MYVVSVALVVMATGGGGAAALLLLLLVTTAIGKCTTLRIRQFVFQHSI